MKALKITSADKKGLFSRFFLNFRFGKICAFRFFISFERERKFKIGKSFLNFYEKVLPDFFNGGKYVLAQP